MLVKLQDATWLSFVISGLFWHNCSKRDALRICLCQLLSSTATRKETFPGYPFFFEQWTADELKCLSSADLLVVPFSTFYCCIVLSSVASQLL